MPTILGSGEHRYRAVENWPKLPEGWNLTDVASMLALAMNAIRQGNVTTGPVSS